MASIRFLDNTPLTVDNFSYKMMSVKFSHFKEDAVFSKKVLGGLAAAATLILTLSGCTASTSDPGEETLDLGVITDVVSFDPAQSDVGQLLQFLQPAYDALIRLDEEGELQPFLATEWEYTDADNKVLELTLREDVVFSDGEKLDAASVVSSLERFKASNGPRASALAAVDSFEAVDASTVRLTLSAPDPALVHNLALVAGMITNPSADPDELASIPAGTGPYVLDTEATRRGDVYVFIRNENYYDPSAFPFDKVTLRVLTDPTARLNAVKTGQIDATLGFAAQIAEAEASGLSTLSWPGDWQGLFLVDRAGQTTPALADARVRQAINYAIDGDGILETVTFGEGEPTTQMFYPGTPAYDPALDSAYPFDPEKARELLAEAGYPDGFTLSMPSSDAFLPEVYPLLQQQLADVGITVEFTPLPASSGIAPLLGGEFPAFFFSWGASQNWLDATLLLSAQGAWNPFHADDPEIADLMSRIAVAAPDQQDALCAELSAYVVDQAWFAPLYVQNNLAFYGPDITVTPQAQQSNPALYNYKPAN